MGLSLLIWLIVGALAGWIAGKLVHGAGFGLLGNIAIGIVGAAIAGALLPMLEIAAGGGFLRTVFHAVIGAVVLLVLAGLIRR